MLVPWVPTKESLGRNERVERLMPQPAIGARLVLAVLVLSPVRQEQPAAIDHRRQPAFVGEEVGFHPFSPKKSGVR